MASSSISLRRVRDLPMRCKKRITSARHSTGSSSCCTRCGSRRGHRSRRRRTKDSYGYDCVSTIVISEHEFTALRDLIRERFGIYYDDTKQFLLQSRLQTRLLKCRVADFAGYHRFLTSSPDREAEWSELASVL